MVNNFPPRVGGVENHVAELSRSLVGLGHSVLVVTLDATPSTEVWHGVRVIRLREYARVANILGFPGWGTRRKLTALLRAEHTDVVSVHTRFFPMSWVGMRAAKRAGVAVVHTEHGSGHVVSSSPVIACASRIVDFTVGRAVLRHADEVLGVSESVTEFVERLSGRDARVFYNAIAEVPQSAPGLNRPSHLVFVGRIVPGKGWDVFVRTVGTLRARGYAVTAEVLGDGGDLPALTELVARLGLSHVVTIRGRVSGADVRAALAGATLVNPTVLAEGFQTTLLEALAEGGRVVTYPVPGAAALQAAGYPVYVTADRDPEALAAGVAAGCDAVSDPRPAPALTAWYWPTRAQEYADLSERLLRSASKR